MKKPITAKEVEKLIRQLAAVYDCRVVIDDWGAIKEIHVLASDSRHPKVIVRDVESALAARFGLMVDHKRISIAQIVDQHKNFGHDRLSLIEMVVHRKMLKNSIVVEARLCDMFRQDNVVEVEEYRGQASGLNHEGELERLAAEAILDAVNPLLSAGYYLHLEEIGRHRLGAYQIVNTVVYLEQPEGGVVLTGSAVTDDDLATSAARSCLSAINRRLSVIRSAHPFAHSKSLSAIAKEQDKREQPDKTNEGWTEAAASVDPMPSLDNMFGNNGQEPNEDPEKSGSTE